MLPEDLLHPGPQPGLFLGVPAGTGIRLGVVTGATDAQRLAHHRHGEARLFQLSDHGIDLLQVGWLKMAKAFVNRVFAHRENVVLVRHAPGPTDPELRPELLQTLRRIRHAEIVDLFAGRLREVRHSRGMPQAELAHRAHVTVSYIGRLEAGGDAPGIDLVDRLARASGTTVTELLPSTAPPDTLTVLREQARRLFDALVATADRETLVMLNPILDRLVESSSRSR